MYLYSLREFLIRGCASFDNEVAQKSRLEKWTKTSEEIFRLWYEDKSGDFDRDVESFYSVLNTLILDTLPEKEVKASSEKSKPC